MNKITGEKTVVIGGQGYTMRYTWKALAEVEEKYGDKPNLFNPEVIACVASAGMRDRHPEMTAEEIMRLSPPLIPFARDVQLALQWAYFGAEAIPKDDDAPVKKNRPAGGLWRRFVTLLRRAFPRRNSGN